jgi:phosphoglycolate phosphatase-like HAD superfamily hydrolase
MSIVSTRTEKSSMGFLNAFELLRFFPIVATALTCPHTKPYSDPVLWAAEKMGLPPENCLMIGDTVVDVRAGRAAGAQTVGVLCGFGTENELRRAGADLILETTAELANVLGK